VTVAVDDRRREYPGNGVTTAFNGPMAYSADVVFVYLVDDVTRAVTPVATSGFDLQRVGREGGTRVVMVVPPPVGQTLLLLRNVPYSQLTDITNQSAFNADVLERGLDLLGMQTQQLADGINRSLRVADTVVGFSSELTDPIPLSPVVVNAAGDGFESGSTTLTGDMLLRPNLAASSGSSLVGFLQSGTGAVDSTVERELRMVVRPQQYGAVGDGVTDDSAAIIRAITYLQTNMDSRGGVIDLGRGTFKCDATLAFTAYAAGLVHNITLRGDGPGCTSLDFSGAPALSDGVTFNKGVHFAVENLTIANAKRDGLAVNVGETPGSANYCSMFTLRNVRVQGSGRDGFRLVNAYLGTIEDCWSKNNTENGFSFGGFHTSMRVSRCEASDNVKIGFSVNGMVYSAFDNCGSDNNTLQGWAISNVQGLKVTACGAESNGRDGWLLFSSTASAAGLNAQSSDIHGLVLDGCYSLSNSLTSAGTYATFVNVSTANSRPINFKVIGGAAHPATVSDKAMILAGTSGAIVCSKDMFYDGAFTAADSTSGTVEVQNKTVEGRRCLLTNSATQTFTTGTEATVLWNATPVDNALGATASTTTITIPRGVNRVRVSAGAAWTSNSTGYRNLKVFKNAAGGSGLPNLVLQANLISQHFLCSPVIPVVAGDTFQIQASQTSGGNLDLLFSASNWFCVEAIG